MKETLKLSFFQLMVIYTVLVFAVSAEFLSRYTLHFELFALILAVLGIFALKDERLKVNEKFITILFVTALFFCFVFRMIPYRNNEVPLGYDPGIYKYIFERFEKALPDIPEEELDSWIRSGFPSGLPTLIDELYLLGFTPDEILKPVFIIFSSLLIFPIYLVAKKYYGKETSIIASLLYAFSYTQLQTFWFMYYKNVVGMALLLFAIYFMDQDDRKYTPLMILFATMLGFTHRPTFLILAMVWLSYILLNLKKIDRLKENIIRVLTTGILLFTLYLPRFKETILQPLEGVFGSILEPGMIGSGTFFSLFKYQYTSLSYLPFALLGFLYLAIKKRLNPLFLWFLINGFIVYFKIMFYNRFIIQLDIVAIILASVGLMYGIVIPLSKKGIGLFITLLLLVSSGIITYNSAVDMKPLLTSTELASIQKISKLTEEDAYVMATSSYYSPWILGYSGRKTIAPGLFDYDKWDEEGWRRFWNADSLEEIKDLLDMYEKPLYIYIGWRSSIINLEKFENGSFRIILNDEGGILYKYVGDKSDD